MLILTLAFLLSCAHEPSLSPSQARFWTEIYDGAKLFYLSGIQHGRYLKREVFNLARFISVMKMRPLTWRLAHPYTIVDRFEVSRVQG